MRNISKIMALVLVVVASFWQTGCGETQLESNTIKNEVSATPKPKSSIYTKEENENVDNESESIIPPTAEAIQYLMAGVTGEVYSAHSFAMRAGIAQAIVNRSIRGYNNPSNISLWTTDDWKVLTTGVDGRRDGRGIIQGAVYGLKSQRGQLVFKGIQIKGLAYVLANGVRETDIGLVGTSRVTAADVQLTKQAIDHVFNKGLDYSNGAVGWDAYDHIFRAAPPNFRRQTGIKLWTCSMSNGGSISPCPYPYINSSTPNIFLKAREVCNNKGVCWTNSVTQGLTYTYETTAYEPGSPTGTIFWKPTAEALSRGIYYKNESVMSLDEYILYGKD